MFRLFLKKKVIEGDEQTNSDSTATVRAQAQDALAKNRRVFNRFNVDHKHLTLMNDQDILLIREISSKGFSCDVSQRGFERFSIGDVYEARMRYLRESYDLSARVAWKADHIVGFEIKSISKSTADFIKRLLRPIEIAQSMLPVDPNFLKTEFDEKSWFHGDQETDLYVWKERDSGVIRAWQLSIGKNYIEWQNNRGLETGTLRPAKTPESGLIAASDMQEPDRGVDTSKRQMAIDVIMALQDPVKNLIIETMED